MGGGVRWLGGGARGKTRYRKAFRIPPLGSARAPVGAHNGTFRPAVRGDGSGVAGRRAGDDLRGVSSRKSIHAQLLPGVNWHAAGVSWRRISFEPLESVLGRIAYLPPLHALPLQFFAARA